MQQLREQGYAGGYSIRKEFVRRMRPGRPQTFLTLRFAPGECAQIDWGYAGPFGVGSTRRRLSFLVLVLCHSRAIYVEFALSETLEQFLAIQQNAFRAWGGAPKMLMVDNRRSAVLSHPRGQSAVYSPRYLDFAAHYACELRACNVRAPHEKGRVENGVGYVKKNFLAGLDLSGSLAGLNAQARRWVDEVANVRIHGEPPQARRGPGGGTDGAAAPAGRALRRRRAPPRPRHPPLPRPLRRQPLFGSARPVRRPTDAVRLSRKDPRL